MKELQKAAPHLITALGAIAAFVGLALDNKISGGMAFGGVMAAGGFTLGTVGASASISTAAAAAVDVSHSASTPGTTSATPSSTSPATGPSAS